MVRASRGARICAAGALAAGGATVAVGQESSRLARSSRFERARRSANAAIAAGDIVYYKPGAALVLNVDTSGVRFGIAMAWL